LLKTEKFPLESPRFAGCYGAADPR
jgi:hypothetical protein